MPSNHLQIRTLTGVITEIPALPQRMKNFFARPDAATMEEAITLFMDGMEAQERCGFNDLHCLLGRLPVPTVKATQAMTHKDALERGFIPSMTEEEQKRFTPSKLILYKHALEYRYKQFYLQCIQRMNWYILVHT